MRWFRRREREPKIENIELLADDVLVVYVKNAVTQDQAHVIEERVALAFSHLCFHDVVVLAEGMRLAKVSGEHV